jgi:multiple sugar transport system substrate-binding protein
MFTHKKRSFVLGLLALLLMLASACGPVEQPAQVEPPSAEAEPTQKPMAEEPKATEVSQEPVEPVSLRFWIASSSDAAKASVDVWNAANPNIQVEVVPFSNNDEGQTQLDTALLAGEVDVFVNYGVQRFVARQDAGLLAALDEYLPDFDVEKEFGTSVTVVDGKTWGIPAHAQPYFVYLNKSDFDNAGIAIPTSWTWDEFNAIAEQLTTGSGPTKRFAVMFPRWPYTNELAYYNLGWDFNVDDKACTTNFDNPIWIDAINIRAIPEVELGVAIPYADIRAANLQLESELYNNRVSMVVAGGWVLRNALNPTDYPRDFITTFAPMPTFSDGDYPYRPGKLEDWTAVASTSKHPVQAAEFLRWFVTEGYAPMIADGRFSAWNGYSAEQQADLFLPAGAEELIDVEAFKNVVLNNEKDFDNPSIIIGLAEIEAIYREEAIRVLAGEISAQEAVENMKQRADQAIAGLCK